MSDFTVAEQFLMKEKADQILDEFLKRAQESSEQLNILFMACQMFTYYIAKSAKELGDPLYKIYTESSDLGTGEKN